MSLFKKFTSILVILVLLNLFLVNNTFAQTFSVPFNSNSIWNKPISANPQVHPNSSQMIQYLRSAYPSLWVDGINGLWSVPVYTSNPSTPVQKICDPTGAHPCLSWPVPTDTIPTPDDDGKIALLDPVTQRVFSGWQFKPGTYGGGQWTVGGGAFGWSDYSQNGDGIRVWTAGNSGGRVSLWNYYAGLLYPEEIQQGHIDHALHINIPASRAKQGYQSGGFVWPAFHSDGQSTDPNAIPLGVHFQLDPSVNVDALNLSSGAKVVAKALQKYGAWLGDTGSLTTINARQYMNSNGTVNSAPWQGVLAPGDFANLPMDKMRILVTNQSDYYVENTTTSPAPAIPTSTPVAMVTGDANGDSLVNGVDYIIWLNHYGQNVGGATNGDFNNSGKVDGVDYVLWLNNYGL